MHVLEPSDIIICKISIIPGQRDIRPVISPGKGQCMSEAEEVPSPRHFHGSTQALTRDVTGLTSRWPGIQLTTMLRLF